MPIYANPAPNDAGFIFALQIAHLTNETIPFAEPITGPFGTLYKKCFRPFCDRCALIPGHRLLPNRYSSFLFSSDLFCFPFAVKIPAFSAPQYSTMD